VDNRPLEIRLESVGGLGAHAAAEALASAAVWKLGLNASAFPSRVPERKGTPARSSIRVAAPDQALGGSGELAAADAIVVFHAGLLREPATYAGLRKDGTLIYAAPAKTVPEELSALPASARVIRVDAYGIAAKQKCEAGDVLLAALCGAFPLLAESGFARDASECEALSGLGQAEGDLPVAAAAQAGAAFLPGGSIWSDLSIARSGFLPAFNRERCIHCALCETVCPDLCLAWEEGEKGGRFERELTGVDYRYCKGCLRCVETCPASAMLKKAETPGLAARLTVPLFPDLVE
jgi:pyruvate ferredoxin oxidoreductase gamma subunit